MDFSDPYVEETLVSYEGEVLPYTSEHLSCHSCHASLLQALQPRRAHHFMTVVDLTDIQRCVSDYTLSRRTGT